eukprot:10067446-Prorocentrum_lima.AAC.1
MGIEATFASKAGPDLPQRAAAVLPKGRRLDMEAFMMQVLEKDGKGNGLLPRSRLWSLRPLHNLLI